MGDHSSLATDLQPIYVTFMQDLNLSQPAERYESEKLLEAVLEFARSTGVPHPVNSHSYQCLILGFSYADCCFPYHDLEVKVYVSIYTWLAIICDDAEQLGTTSDIEMFQRRYIMREEQPTATLKAFSDQLRLTYDFYHPLIANLIVSASFNFITTTALTAREGVKEKTKNPSKGGNCFPWYMRERDGIGEAYAWFTFPMRQFPSLETPIEAIDDMSRFIAFANDVLSFYKETLANETDNYVYTTSVYNGTDAFSTLRETAQDAIDCIRRTESVLLGKGDYERAWKLHAAGYIQMHLVRGRYRLREVGLGDLPLCEEAVMGT